MNRYQVYYGGDKKFTEIGYIYLEQAIEQVKKYFKKGYEVKITFKGKTVFKY